MSLSIKRGVRVYGLRPETTIALQVVVGAFEDAGYPCTLTCAMDGKHSKGSLHYAGCAMDFRSHHIPKEKLETLRQTIVDRLTEDYDVVLEGDHFHIEYQPKNFYGA